MRSARLLGLSAVTFTLVYRGLAGCTNVPTPGLFPELEASDGTDAGRDSDANADADANADRDARPDPNPCDSGNECDDGPAAVGCAPGKQCQCTTGMAHNGCGASKACRCLPIPLEAGAPCVPSAGDCSMELHCDCAGRICVRDGQEGTACHSNEDCVAGLRCADTQDAGVADFTCASSAPPGTCIPY